MFSFLALVYVLGMIGAAYCKHFLSIVALFSQTFPPYLFLEDGSKADDDYWSIRDWRHHAYMFCESFKKQNGRSPSRIRRETGRHLEFHESGA